MKIVQILTILLLVLCQTAYAASSISIEPSTPAGEDWEIRADDDGLHLHNTDDAATRMLIDNSGNIGVGLTNPSQPLEVNGPIAVSSNFAGYHLRGASGNLRFILKYGDAGVVSGSNLAISNTESNGDILFLTSPGGGGFNERARMVIDGATGNVGIGTTNPGSKLSISGATFVDANDGALSVRGAENDGAKAAIEIRTAGTGQRMLIDGNEIDSLQGSIDMNKNSDGNVLLVPKTGGVGKVGVGTSSPDEKLHVDGNIKLSGNLVTDGEFCIGNC